MWSVRGLRLREIAANKPVLQRSFGTWLTIFGLSDLSRDAEARIQLRRKSQTKV
jgi:hypothetical protein